MLKLSCSVSEVIPKVLKLSSEVSECPCSTGGIIALGLSRGVPLEALEQMYYDIGKRVFGKQSAVRQAGAYTRPLFSSA